MAEGDWITRPVAARTLGVGIPAIDKLIAEGRLTIRSIPGS